MCPVLIVAGDLVIRNMQKDEVFRQMCLLVCTSVFCPPASKVPKPPSRVCESAPVSTIEKNDTCKLKRPRWVTSEGAKGAGNVRPFSSIFERSWHLVEVPDDWRKANVTPVFGKGGKEDSDNIRPVSLTFIPRKVVGQIFLEAISQNMQDTKVTGSSQPR